METGGPSVPSQNPGSAPPAYEAPGGNGGQSSSPSGLWWGAAVVVAIALGVGGYFLGSNHEADNYKPGAAGYQEIYTAGAQAGTAVGTEAGKKAGARYGAKVGFKSGNAAGIKEGAASGTSAGAAAALGGFSWTTGTHYIVTTIDPTLKGVPAAIQTQSPMVANTAYALCQANPAQICSKPETK